MIGNNRDVCLLGMPHRKSVRGSDLQMKSVGAADIKKQTWTGGVCVCVCVCACVCTHLFNEMSVRGDNNERPWLASYKGFLPLNQLFCPLCACTALLSPRATLTAKTCTSVS